MSEWAIPGANALLAGAAFPTTFFVKGHLGDPGTSGTANPASDTRRIEVDMGPMTPAEDGKVENISYGEILNATHLEDWTHVTFWDLSVGGICWMIDELTPMIEIEIGQTVSVALGQFVLTLPLWT